MTKKYLNKSPCPSCPSSDGFQAIEENGDVHYHCFVCGYHVTGDDPVCADRDSSKTGGVTGYPMDSHKKTLESLAQGVQLKERGISSDIASEYGVLVECSPETGEQVAYYFPRTREGKVVGYQVRRLPKSFYTIGDVKSVEFFGASIVGDGGQFLIVTEGNEDCLAARQMLRDLGKHYRVVSMPSGANIRAVKDNLEWLERFEKIVLCVDQDDPGRKLAAEFAGLLTPGKVRIARFSEKDANDMLRKHKAPEFLQAINNARPQTPDGIVSIEDIYEEAIKPVEWGLSWPWPTLTKLTYGRRRKELYGFGAGTGAGKTEAFKEVIRYIVEEDNLPVGVFFLEEHPSYTVKVLAGKMHNKKYHVPDGDWTPEELKESIGVLSGKVYLYNHFGQKDWTTIKSKIRYMVVSLGIKDIFLDHLTAVVADAVDVNKELERVMADMAALTQELNFSLYFVSHLTTPSNGPSHEEGGRVTTSQFRGSRTIGYWSHFLFGFERDQQAEEEGIRNTVTFRVLKDRYTGIATGHTFPLYYNQKTGRFLEDVVEEF